MTPYEKYLFEEARAVDPDWDAGGPVHNWRNYVGERTRELWSTFTHEQRYALVHDADEMASREDWD